MTISLAQQLAKQGFVSQKDADSVDDQRRADALTEEAKRVASIEAKRRNQERMIPLINVPEDVLIGC